MGADGALSHAAACRARQGAHRAIALELGRGRECQRGRGLHLAPARQVRVRGPSHPYGARLRLYAGKRGCALSASVRSRLLVWLVAPLALVLGAAAVLAYQTALGVATDAYDRSLLDPALAIAEELKMTDGGVALSMSTEALEALRVDTSDRLFFS